MSAIGKVTPASGRGPRKDTSKYPMNVEERSEVGHSSSSERRRLKNVTKTKPTRAVKGKTNADAKVFKARGFSFGRI